MKTKITNLFGIKYPIISGGMVWCSGHKLATAVSGAGGLGLIGAGSMHPEVLM
ncbi:MAG: nitronate monooxygenase, partial [Mucinivorans sp.]